MVKIRPCAAGARRVGCETYSTWVKACARCFRKYDLFQDMVECLYDESDALLDQMGKALEGRDSEDLVRAAHRLKGTVVFLWSPRAAEAARRVEQIGLLGGTRYRQRSAGSTSRADRPAASALCAPPQERQ